MSSEESNQVTGHFQVLRGEEFFCAGYTSVPGLSFSEIISVGFSKCVTMHIALYLASQFCSDLSFLCPGKERHGLRHSYLWPDLRRKWICVYEAPPPLFILLKSRFLKVDLMRESIQFHFIGGDMMQLSLEVLVLT